MAYPLPGHRTRPGLTIQGLSPWQSQAALLLPQCLKELEPCGNAVLTWSEVERPQGSLGNGDHFLCQMGGAAAMARCSSAAHVEQLCLPLACGQGLLCPRRGCVPRTLGLQHLILLWRGERAGPISETYTDLWKLLVFVALTSKKPG